MKLNEKNKNENFSYLKAGITAFGVICAVILFFFVIYKIDSIFAFFGKILSILQPVIMGAVIAFLINPISKFIYRISLKFLNKIFKKQGKFTGFCKYFSILFSLLLFILLISVFFYMIIPEFVRTLTNLINALPDQVKALSAWVINLMESNSDIADIINKSMATLDNWFQTNIVPNATTYAGYLANGVIDVVNFVMDFLIGVVVAFYILASKNPLKAQFKKLLLAIFGTNHTKKVVHILRKSDKIFSGFINGKLITALLIGICCFIGCSIIGVPYVMLISVVIAVTDMIPIFGPYIGAIPCGLIILLDSPIKCLYFAVFIIVLQAFEGNVISPKILGDSTGLSAFWVMVAILLFGGLFGIIGMLIGVPLFAVLYNIVKITVNFMLSKNGINIQNENTDACNSLLTENAGVVENNEQKSADKTE